MILTPEQESMTAAELKAWFDKNPTDEPELKRQRKIAYHHKVLVEKYDIENKTVQQMDSMMEPKGAGQRALWSVIRKKKKIVEDGVKRVDKYDADYAAWVSAGKPADSLRGINGLVSYSPPEEVE